MEYLGFLKVPQWDIENNHTTLGLGLRRFFENRLDNIY